MNKRESQNKAFQVIDFLISVQNQKNISSYKISRATGLSDSCLSRIKAHKQNPTLATLIAIAKEIGADWHDIADIINRD